jgi:hypothetical protein
MRNQIDLVADYTMDKIYLAINPSYVTYNPMIAKAASWYGAAGYGQYSVTDKLAIGGRLGYIKNEDSIPLNTGRTTFGTSKEMWDMTLSAHVKLAEGLKIIPEFRIDKTDSAIYRDADGKATNSQYTVGLAAMYSF